MKGNETRKQVQMLVAYGIRHDGSRHPTVVKRLGQDLPELLAFFAFPRHLWRRLRTTNVIERCFVEVRRRTRPIVCFVNVESVDRIIYSIFQRFNLEWKTRTSTYLHKRLDVTRHAGQLEPSTHSD